jgi:hypothetical protein
MNVTCSAYKSDEKCIQKCLESLKPYGRPKHRWEDNTKMDIMEIGF